MKKMDDGPWGVGYTFTEYAYLHVNSWTFHQFQLFEQAWPYSLSVFLILKYSYRHQMLKEGRHNPIPGIERGTILSFYHI